MVVPKAPAEVAEDGKMVKWNCAVPKASAEPIPFGRTNWLRFAVPNETPEAIPDGERVSEGKALHQNHSSSRKRNEVAPLRVGPTCAATVTVVVPKLSADTMAGAGRGGRFNFIGPRD